MCNSTINRRNEKMGGIIPLLNEIHKLLREPFQNAVNFFLLVLLGQNSIPRCYLVVRLLMYLDLLFHVGYSTALTMFALVNKKRCCNLMLPCTVQDYMLEILLCKK